jgi:hypothetical protein
MNKKRSGDGASTRGAFERPRACVGQGDPCLLGEYHDCVLLETFLVAGTALPADDAFHVLRLVRRYQRSLRQKAQSEGAQIYNEAPRQFVKRVERAWRLAAERKRSRDRAAEERTSWAHAA